MSSQATHHGAYRAGASKVHRELRRVTELESHVSDGQRLPHHLLESAEELRSYLADGIPPLLAAGAVAELIREAPRSLDAQIQGWLSYQHQARGSTVPFVDLAFHALRKLYLIGELGLAPRKELAGYLASLVEVLVPLCPEEDREFLRGSLERLRMAPQEMAGSGFQVSAALARARAGVPGGGAAELSPELRRFALLLARVKSPGEPGAPGKASSGPGDALVSALLAAAATSARNGSELGQYLQHLRGLGVAGTDPAVVRTLSRALPAWAPATVPTPDAFGGNAQALRRFVGLADEPEKRLERFREVVTALLEEFNTGSLARAVALVHVATSLLAEKRVPPAEAELVLGAAHDRLDGKRLRAYALDSRQQPLLRQIMAFFPALRPAGLLAALDDEPDRALRRLRLTLIELHGEAARPAILDRLDSSLTDTGETAWFWQRNLVYLLHRVPCPADVLEERELDAVLQFSALSYHPRLVGEAVTRLAQIPHERAQEALLARVREVEAGIDAEGLPGQSLEDLERLRALLATHLLRGDFPAGRRAIVEMALHRLHETGDTDRVAELRTADLSAEPVLVDELLQVLRDGLPRKLLGVTVRRKAASLTQVIEGLSSTPTSAVRGVLKGIAERFPREPFGLEASKVLAGFDAPHAPERSEAGPESAAAPAPAPQGMEGDLKIFGLPNLLQSLGQNEVTGTLTLRDRQGTPVGVLDLRAGELAFCSTGRLQGEEAFYQLLERPLATSFQLTSGDPPKREARDGKAQRPLVAMLLEGMRRYDEYERACALVPDAAVLVPTGTRPTSLPGETDGVFVRDLWSRVKGGATAAACEEALATDAFRVRALLAHWLAEGAVETSQFGPPPATP